MNFSDYQSISFFRALPKVFFDEYTQNIEAFKRITLRPRVLVDVSRIDLSTTIMGHRISAPLMIAPTGFLQFAHPDGEVGAARAAAAFNTIMVYKRRDISTQLVQQAEKNGYKAIVLTVDTPRLGGREEDIKNKIKFGGFHSGDLRPVFELEKSHAGKNIWIEDMLENYDIRWLRSITRLPILIKGVLTRADAMKAVEVGVDGIIVSNHGARQLDYSPATISVLEEVVGAVRGKVPVLLDGGVRRGTDVFKALALGAQAVLVGRPVIYGLAAEGERGVKKVLQMLTDEFEITMALSGCSDVKDISRNHVRTQGDVLHSNLRSLFPYVITSISSGSGGSA